MDSEINKMLEMMQKLNPTFKLNEDSFGRFNNSFGDTQTQSTETTPKNGDVKNYNKASQNAKSLANKSTKINNRTEFPEAFRVWFNSLGYSPEKGNITIATALAEIRKVMAQMGYR